MIKNIKYDIDGNGAVCYTVHEVNSMRYKLSQIPPPALAGVVKEKSVKQK